MKYFFHFFAFLSLYLHANENMNMETPPEYLYKILSYTNWQATQSHWKDKSIRETDLALEGEVKVSESLSR